MSSLCWLMSDKHDGSYPVTISNHRLFVGLDHHITDQIVNTCLAVNRKTRWLMYMIINPWDFDNHLFYGFPVTTIVYPLSVIFHDANQI